MITEKGNFVYGEDGNVKWITDPNGKWELVKNIPEVPILANYKIGIDPYYKSN